MLVCYLHAIVMRCVTFMCLRVVRMLFACCLSVRILLCLCVYVSFLGGAECDCLTRARERCPPALIQMIRVEA